MADIVFANETMVATVAENLEHGAAAAFSMMTRICYIPGQRQLFRELQVALPQYYDDSSSDVYRRASFFAGAKRFAEYVRVLRLHMGEDCDDGVDKGDFGEVEEWPFTQLSSERIHHKPLPTAMPPMPAGA